MILDADRTIAVDLINEAVTNGAAKYKACIKRCIRNLREPKVF